MKKLTLCSLVLIVFISWLPALEPIMKGVPALNEALNSYQTSGEMVPVYLMLKDNYNENQLYNEVQNLSRQERRDYTVKTLSSFSAQSQSSLRPLLEQMEKEGSVANLSFLWITNIIRLEAAVEALKQLDSFEEIAKIVYDPYEDVLFSTPGADKSGRLNQSGRDTGSVTRNPAANVVRVRAPQVWDQGYQGEGVTVAVLDTGVNYNHRDLVNRMWTHPNYPNHGWNFVGNNNNPLDDQGHGSHCAGTVAGDGTAGTQTGIAPEASIMALKVIASNGQGTVGATINGIQFAVENGADVLSISLGWRNAPNNDRSSLRTTMVNALSAGVVAAVAVGNEGAQGNIPNNVRSPGNCPPPWLNPHQTITGGVSAVISVGATNDNNTIANFSSRGPVTWQTVAPYNDYAHNPGIGLITPDIVAPGVNVNSLRHNNNSGYVTQSGTSMACPAVAGVIALMLSKDPAMQPEEVSQVVEETALALSETKSNIFGAGRIDALNAIEAVVGTNPPNAAVRPIPDNEALFVGATPVLRWSNGGGARSYNVYLGTDNPPTNALNGVNTEDRFYQINNALQSQVTYYWRIDSVNPNGVRTGTVWSFETSAPNSVITPEPAVNATDVRIMPMLRWFNGGGATSYSVYIGTDNPPTNVINGENAEETNYQVIANLDPLTLHYWRIDAVNDNGSTDGTVWSFTTGVPPGEGFESGDFSFYPWQTDFSGPNAVPWFVDDQESFSGQYAARSGAIGHGSTTSLLITLELFEPGQISFARKVSTEQNFDFLGFYINNTLIEQWSGELDWDEFTYPVAIGRQTFRWVYSKNPTGIAGQDAVWIDDVTFPELGVPTPQLTPPGDVTCGMNLDHIKLRWGLPTERPVLLGYNIFRSLGNPANFVKINDEVYTANTYKDAVEAEGTYYYYITSVFESGESDPSDIVSTDVAEAVSSPHIYPESGDYNEAIEVVISNGNNGSLLYYTLDGSDPGSASILYEEPFILTESVMVRVRALKNGHLPSEIVEAQYTVFLAVDEDELLDSGSFVSVYPNPVRGGTSISSSGVNIAYSFPQAQDVSIQIFNVKGQMVRTLPLQQSKTPVWDLKDNLGRNVGTGLYFIKVKTNSEEITRRLMIIR